MEVTEAVDAVKVVEEGDKTQVYSQGASIAIEKNLSKDISPASSQEPCSQPSASHPPHSEQREEDMFQDKSTSFRNNKALTLAFSRVSFPRNLDKVLKLRREQMNRTLQTLKDADISSDIDSYSDSPRPSLQNQSSAASIHVPDATSIMFEKTSLVMHDEEVSKMQNDSMRSVTADVTEKERDVTEMPQSQVQSQGGNPDQGRSSTTYFAGFRLQWFSGIVWFVSTKLITGV